MKNCKSCNTLCGMKYGLKFFCIVYAIFAKAPERNELAFMQNSLPTFVTNESGIVGDFKTDVQKDSVLPKAYDCDVSESSSQTSMVDLFRESEICTQSHEPIEEDARMQNKSGKMTKIFNMLFGESKMSACTMWNVLRYPYKLSQERYRNFMSANKHESNV